MKLPGNLLFACRGPLLTSLEVGGAVSSSLFGALLGSVGAFFVGDKIGRKKELLLAAALYGEQKSICLNLIPFYQHICALRNPLMRF